MVRVQHPWPSSRDRLAPDPGGGDYAIERLFCRSFAHYGFHVALVHRKTLKVSPEHPVERLELLLRQGVIRFRQVVDWLEQNERVDPTRMASFGISMGGMASVLAAAVEPRLSAHVAALAGGSLPDILMTSRDRMITKQLSRYLRENDLDRETLEARFRQVIRTDPLQLAPYADARNMLFVIALADRTIGTANGFRLWRALGRPKVIFLPFGHYTSYLMIPYIKFASIRLFQDVFNTSRAGDAP